MSGAVMGAQQVDALRQIQAWIEHWQADVAAGLKPTPESLEQARLTLQRAMSHANAQVSQ